MVEESKMSKRKARPLLIAGAGITLIALAGGSLACGNLISRPCGDGGVEDFCSPLFGQTLPTDGGTDGGSDGGSDGGP